MGDGNESSTEGAVESGREKRPEGTPGTGEKPAAGSSSTSASARSAIGTEDDLSDLSGLPDPVREVIRKEREARREAERRATEATSQLQRRNEADMTELERAKAETERHRTENDRLTSELRRRTITEEIVALASKVGIADPRLAARLLDMSSIELDGDGKPKGLTAKLTALKAEYPILAARTVGSADAGKSGNGATEDDINARIREQARRR